MNYQWNVFWANLDPARGPEQTGNRPVLVISIEEVNQALPIVTVLSMTSMRAGRKVYPIEVLVKAVDTGLPQDSIVLAHQIRAISKERLGDIYGNIKSEALKEDQRDGKAILRSIMDYP